MGKSEEIDEDYESDPENNYISPAQLIHIIGKHYGWTDEYILSLTPAHLFQKLIDIKKEYDVQKKEMSKVGKKRPDGSSMFSKKRRDTSFVDSINKFNQELDQKYTKVNDDGTVTKLTDQWKFVPTVKGK